MVYGRGLLQRRDRGFEVDSTESIWYSVIPPKLKSLRVLKLTPQSQYGISEFDFVFAFVLF